MDHLESMRTFLKVAELASFTQAARALGLPKANVSLAVSKLEAHFGIRLLHRTTRRVNLSQDGQVFVERARDLLEGFDELSSQFQGGDRTLIGRIRVDMPTGIARDVIVPHLPEFLEAHPKIEVELSSTERMVDLASEGFDCTVRAWTRSDSTLIARPLGHYAMANCISPSYRERWGTPERLEDLEHHRLVHYAAVFGRAPDGFEYLDPKTGREREIPMRGRITVDNATSYIAACRAGLGIIQVPRVGVAADLATGALLEVLPQWAATPMPVSLVYLNRRHQPRRVRAFMDWAAGLIRPHLHHASQTTCTGRTTAKRKGKETAKRRARSSP